MLVREELKTMLSEAREKAPDIAKKLEDLRKKFEPEEKVREANGWASNTYPQKRVQINTVAKLIDVPVSELMLFFMNNTKLGLAESNLVDYHLGHVYFHFDEHEQ